MKKMILPVVAAVVCASVLSAGAAEVRPYVAVNLGMVIDSDSTLSNEFFSGTLTTKPGYAATGAVGLDFGAARVEAEVGYRTTDVDTISSNGTTLRFDGTTQLVSYMLNGHLTVPGRATVKPFITGGVGVATARWSDVTSKGLLFNQAGSDTQFAYQVGGGISYDATRNVSLDGGYRFLGTRDFKIDELNVGYHSHNVMIAIRYKF